MIGKVHAESLVRDLVQRNQANALILPDRAIPSEPLRPLALVVDREQADGVGGMPLQRGLARAETREYDRSLEERHRRGLIRDRHRAQREGERDLDHRATAGMVHLEESSFRPGRSIG